MKYFIYQGNDHDCGFAALKMYLATIFKDKSYLYIPKPTKRGSYTADDLAEIAAKYGAQIETCGCTKDYLEHLEIPCITLIDDNHVVMIKKRGKRYLTLYDPGRGKVKIRKEEFLRRWRCVIQYCDDQQYLTSKLPKTRQYLISPKLEIITNAFSLLSAGLLILTFYLLNKAENFLYSLVFLSLFVVCQIIDRVLLYKQVYNFDRTYLPNYFGIKENCSKTKYAEYIDYKRKFFTFNRQLIASVLIAFSITFLLCFNDFRNVFALLALILCKVLELIIFSRKEQDTKNVIAEIESRDFTNPENAKENALSANIKADGQVFMNSIKEIYYIFMSFVFAVMMMFINGTMGCNYVIFHFVMYYAGFTAYNHLLEGLSLKKENKMLERRFFDSCNL